jgi:hypothetical protein
MWRGRREKVVCAESIMRAGRGICVPAEGVIEGTHGPLPRLLAIPVSRISTSGSGRGAKILRWRGMKGKIGVGRSHSDSREHEILNHEASVMEDRREERIERLMWL